MLKLRGSQQLQQTNAQRGGGCPNREVDDRLMHPTWKIVWDPGQGRLMKPSHQMALRKILGIKDQSRLLQLPRKGQQKATRSKNELNFFFGSDQDELT